MIRLHYHDCEIYLVQGTTWRLPAKVGIDFHSDQPLTKASSLVFPLNPNIISTFSRLVDSQEQVFNISVLLRKLPLRIPPERQVSLYFNFEHFSVFSFLLHSFLLNLSMTTIFLYSESFLPPLIPDPSAPPTRWSSSPGSSSQELSSQSPR